MVFAGTANAATLAQTGCIEPMPGTYDIILAGGGFAPNAIVALTWTPASALPLPVLPTTVPADASGSFSDVYAVAMDIPGVAGSAFPVSFTATDPVGNSASLTVTSCSGSATAQPEPVDCKQAGYWDFSNPPFQNQGLCVSALASKKK